MSSTIRVAADHKTLRLLDGVVLFWVAFWVALGVWTGVTLWQAADVGDTIASSGRTLDSVGEGLQELAGVPVIGERPGEIGGEVTESAVDITSRGEVVKGQLRQLGVVLGIAVVGIPVSPVLGLYLPLRVRRGRETTSIRRQLDEHADDPGFERYLADRARASLPYATVAALDPSPDHRESDRALADAELARLGIKRKRPASASAGAGAGSRDPGPTGD